MDLDVPERDLLALVLPMSPRVVTTVGIAPFGLVGSGGQPVEPVGRFLRDLVARCRPRERCAVMRSRCCAGGGSWAVGVEWRAVPARGPRFRVVDSERAKPRRPGAGRRR